MTDTSRTPSLFEFRSQEEIDAARGVWMSRLMFNQFVGWPPETRTFEEFLADWKWEKHHG